MRTNEQDTIVVKIDRFGAASQSVNVPEDSTLADVLDAANITLAASETAWVNGVQAKNDSIMDDGDTIQLVGKKEGGLL